MDKSSTTSSSIEIPDYNLIREIQDDVDRSWSSGRKLFEYRVPIRNRDILAMTLVKFSSAKVMTELISERHTILFHRLVTEFGHDGNMIRASFWEQSRFRIDKGHTDARMVVIDGATEQHLNDSINYTSGNPTAPCIILLR